MSDQIRTVDPTIENTSAPAWVSDVDRSQVLPAAKRGAQLLTLGYVVPRLVIPVVLIASIWSVFQGMERYNWFERHLVALGFLDRSYTTIKSAKLELYEYVLGSGRESLENSRKNAVLAHEGLAQSLRRLDNPRTIALVRQGETAFTDTIEKQLQEARADAAAHGDAVARDNLQAKLLKSPDRISDPLVQAHFVNSGDMMLSGERFGERLRDTNLLPAIVGLLATFLGLLFWVTRAYLKQRELSAQVMKKSEAQIKFLIDNIHDGLAIVDSDGEIEGTNRGLLDMLGAAGEEELLGKPLSRVLGGDIEQVLDALEDSALTIVQERQAVRTNGSTFPAEVAIKEVRTLDGSSRVISMRDLTAKKQLERWKQEMVAIVSHDLRTPLTSMRGALGLAISGALGAVPPVASAKLKEAQDNALKMIKLINDLLDLEKLEATVEPPQMVAVDLGAVVTAAANSLKAMANARGVAINVAPVAGLAQQVTGDADLLEKLFFHLLENAIKFSPPDTVVEVAAVANGAWLEIKVRDRGRGIPAELIDAVFLRMKQVEATDRASGNGLGLPLAKAIAHLYGGVIGLESKPGEGTTAWVLLKPLAAPAIVSSAVVSQVV